MSESAASPNVVNEQRSITMGSSQDGWQEMERGVCPHCNKVRRVCEADGCSVTEETHSNNSNVTMQDSHLIIADASEPNGYRVSATVAESATVVDKCNWYKDKNSPHLWDTGCGNCWTISGVYVFCPDCGRRVNVINQDSEVDAESATVVDKCGGFVSSQVKPLEFSLSLQQNGYGHTQLQLNKMVEKINELVFAVNELAAEMNREA